MTEPYLSFNGILANTATLRVPYAGRWLVDIDYDGDEVPSGAATVKVGSLVLVGTVVPAFTGLFLGHVRARVIAGAGGWHKRVASRSYHDDGGVRRAEVLGALARDAGETIDTAGDKTRMRIDFVRLAGPAGAVLEDVLGTTPWRVDFDGVTRYGARPAAELGAEAELLEVPPGTGALLFAAPDPLSVPIGARVVDPRLGGELVVRELEVAVTAGSARISAWGVA